MKTLIRLLLAVNLGYAIGRTWGEEVGRIQGTLDTWDKAFSIFTAAGRREVS